MSCSYTKEKAGSAAAVEKATEWRIFKWFERGTAGKGITCFKIFFGGLGFEF